jgi:peptide/nickel transport system permease protein
MSGRPAAASRPKVRRSRRYPIPTRRHPPRARIYGGPVPLPRRRRPWYGYPRCLAGLIFILLILILSFVLPGVGRCEPLIMDVAARLQGPSLRHWLGTDQFGRDVWCRAVYGTRVSLPIGVLAVFAAVLPGLCLGMLAGYYGGWVDVVVGRLADMMLAFPGILLALLILAWLGPGLGNVMLAIGLTGIPNYVRLTRSRAIQVRRAWFVRAAYVIGCTDARILTRHMLPNILPSVAALATLDIGWAILNAATLSFLGLGAQPPTPEWGAMINEGRGFLRQAPWISLVPGAMVALTVLAVNLLGDGLRDALDPRSR